MAASRGPAPVQFKVVLIGPTDVGKTSLMQRFVDDSFARYGPTLGLEFKSRTLALAGKPVKFQVWVLSGSERFRAISRAQYRHASAVLVLFDVTDRASFTAVRRWYAEAQECAPGVVAVIVGTKADLASRRTVSPCEAQALAEELGVRYVETSALTSENVTPLFAHVGRAILAA